MLSIKTLKGAGGAAHYYSRERAADEYYAAAEVEAPQTWWSPRGTLGVENGAQVRPEQLREAMAGRDPAGSGKGLAQVQRRPGRTERRGGFDLHLAPPKGVSVLYAAADPATRRQMLEDMRRAAVATLAAMHERGAFVCREGKGGKVRAPARDVAVAVVPHQTARDGSPQLHVHCVLINMGRRDNGSTGTLEIGAAFGMKGEAGALFRAGIAAAIERRGLAVERVPGRPGQSAASFCVAGVPPELERAFSPRKAEMERYAERRGGVAQDGADRREQMNRAARHTRGSKARVPGGEALDRRWRETMDRLGTSGREVWERAREAARAHERPRLSSAETVAFAVRERGGHDAEPVRLRQRVAEAAQHRGEGIAGALREMQRLERDGWRQVARETDRKIRPGRGGQARAASRPAPDGGGRKGGAGDLPDLPKPRRRPLDNERTMDR